MGSTNENEDIPLHDQTGGQPRPADEDAGNGRGPENNQKIPCYPQCIDFVFGAVCPVVYFLALLFTCSYGVLLIIYSMTEKEDYYMRVLLCHGVVFILAVAFQLILVIISVFWDPCKKLCKKEGTSSYGGEHGVLQGLLKNLKPTSYYIIKAWAMGTKIPSNVTAVNVNFGMWETRIFSLVLADQFEVFFEDFTIKDSHIETWLPVYAIAFTLLAISLRFVVFIAFWMCPKEDGCLKMRKNKSNLEEGMPSGTYLVRWDAHPEQTMLLKSSDEHNEQQELSVVVQHDPHCGHNVLLKSSDEHNEQQKLSGELVVRHYHHCGHNVLMKSSDEQNKPKNTQPSLLTVLLLIFTTIITVGGANLAVGMWSWYHQELYLVWYFARLYLLYELHLSTFMDRLWRTLVYILLSGQFLHYYGHLHLLRILGIVSLCAHCIGFLCRLFITRDLKKANNAYRQFRRCSNSGRYKYMSCQYMKSRLKHNINFIVPFIGYVVFTTVWIMIHPQK